MTILPARKISIITICIIVQALVIGTYLYCFTFWVNPWIDEFSVSPSIVMIVPTIFLYAKSIVFFFLGKYLDIFQVRNSIIFGLVLFSLSMILLSLSPNMPFIYLVYLIVVPAAVLFAGPAAAIAIVSRAFKERRGLAIGVVGLGSSLGGVLMPHFAAFAIEGWGWRSANLALAVVGLALVPFAFFLIGFEPKAPRGEKVDQTAKCEPARYFFTSSAFWICVVSSTGAYFVFMAIQMNMAPILRELGSATGEVAFAISLFTGGMLIGKILAGYLSDRIDSRFVFLGIGALMATALFAILVQSDHAGLLAAFFVFGMGAGGVTPLKAIILANLFGPERLGRVMGLAAPFVTLYSLGPIFAAFIWEFQESYVPVLYVLLAILLLTVPMILLLPKKGCELQRAESR